MADRRVSVSAQQSSPSHRIRTSCSTQPWQSANLCAEKQATSTRKAEPREVRRSARPKATLQREGRNRTKELEVAGTSRDQAVDISLVLLRNLPNVLSVSHMRGQVWCCGA